jgi:hypothetical protein
MQQITEPYDRKPKPKEALTNIGASICPFADDLAVLWVSHFG